MKESPWRLADIPLTMFEKDILAKPRTNVPSMLLNGRKGQDGIEMPEEGGVLSWFEGMKYPYKGIMVAEPLIRISILKRIILETIRFSTTKPIRYFLPLLILLPKKTLRGIMITAMNSFADLSVATLSDYYLKPFRYCKSGREIYKVGLEVMERSFPELNIFKRKELVKTFCMIWNFDPAYRYRAQDIFGLLNKEALKKNLAKELSRLIGIMISREAGADSGEYIKAKWKKFRVIIPILAKKGLLKEVVEILLNLDLEKIKLDDGDRYNSSVFPDYNFGGVSYQERLEMREAMEHNET